jgi:membrane-associated phospholipid phosphatase
MRLAPVAVLVVACLVAPSARAADETPPASASPAQDVGVTPSPPASPEPYSPPRLTKLSYDWAIDGIVTGGLAASTITLMLLNDSLAPKVCKWCDPGAWEGDLSKSVRWANPGTANTLSDAMQIVVPLGVMGFGLIQGYRLDDPAAGWSSVLLIAEATSLAMLASTIVKYAVGRERPYVWQGNPDLYPGSASDANVSFFSGHTTLVFAVVVSGSTLFFMQGMPGAPYVLGFGLAAAAFTGYLRMAAAKHYLSDVVVGAAVGSLVGWAVPYLFHRPGKGAPQAGDLLPAPGGVAIAW